MGGLIVCDFIDMRESKNRREVEKVFRAELKADRARSRALRMSAFGLIELTRQRVRPSLQLATYLTCPHCGGSGVIKNIETQAIEMMRKLHLATAKKDIKRIEMNVSPELADYLLNKKRAVISQLEMKSEKEVTISSEPKFISSQSLLTCYNSRGSVVKL